MKLRIFFLIALLTSVSRLSAQELTVKSMAVAAGDLTASTQRRLDINQQPCAVVKVQLPLPGAVFEGNVIQPVDYKTNEYWVYMTEGSKELHVKHPNYQTLVVTFPDYGVKSLQSLSTYRLAIIVPQGSASTQTQKQKLTINYSPSNAMVLIDTKPYQGKGSIEVTLPVGSHDYIIAATGYDTVEGTVKLSASSPRTITENLNKAAQETETSSGKQVREQSREQKAQAKAEAKAQKEEQRKADKAANKSNSLLWDVAIGTGGGYSEDFVTTLRAASEGNADAAYRLGQGFETGQMEGVYKNMPAAQYWYDKASQYGSQDAAAALKRLGGIPANQILVWGLVTEKKDKESIIGCSIKVAGTTIGCVSDLNGMFCLAIPRVDAVTLEFSYIGYKKQKLTIDKDQNPPLHIVMR